MATMVAGSSGTKLSGCNFKKREAARLSKNILRYIFFLVESGQAYYIQSGNDERVLLALRQWNILSVPDFFQPYSSMYMCLWSKYSQ